MTEGSNAEKKQVVWQNPKTAGESSKRAADIINRAQGLKILGEQGSSLTENLDDTQPEAIAERLEQAKKLSKRVPTPNPSLNPSDLKD